MTGDKMTFASRRSACHLVILSEREEHQIRERAMTETIRVAIGQFKELSHEQLTFAQQIGASGVLLNTPVLPGDQRWELNDLQWLRRRCDQYGLRLEALENVPTSFYDRAMLGLDGRDQYIMERVLPVAEASGVTLALHPDDPPVPMLGGIARLFGSFEGFRRAVETFDSPRHGLDFCMGCWSEMGPGAIDAIRYFGARGKIVYVHFRDVQGHVPVFQECFLGEGNVDVVAAMRALKQVGFSGFIIDDHVPQLIDDTGWSHRGRAHATGYIMGLVEAVGKLG